jgi:pyruvate-formate lyase-activating enzyme
MSDEFINDIITLANKFKIEKVELLPYHMLGVGKYAHLGREYPCVAGETPSKNEINNCIEVFTKRGYFNVEVL